MDDLSFSVEAGEIFGILRPSRAGKAMTAECVGGLRTAERSQSSVLGLDPRKLGVSDRAVAVAEAFDLDRRPQGRAEGSARTARPSATGRCPVGHNCPVRLGLFAAPRSLKC